MPIIGSFGAGSKGGFGRGGSPKFVEATGGTITESGDYKIHTFTGPGTFEITNEGKDTGSNTVDYLVLAGGGGGGYNRGAGGGAGGYRESVPAPAAWTASPSAAPGGALAAVKGGYPITVGSGGGTNVPGNDSIFSTITSNGGGRGGNGAVSAPGAAGQPGGSGGGGGTINGPGGSGNSPVPTSPPQGFPGGTGGGDHAAGGGGVLGAGPSGQSTPGGPGATSEINASPVARAGGGGGGGNGTGTGNSGGGNGGTNGQNGNAATSLSGSGGGGGGMMISGRV